MELKLLRMQKTDKSTIGEIMISGLHECFTLEPAHPIPAGSYPIISYISPKNDKMLVPLLREVPDHDYVEIHIGNDPDDTDLCILVGQSRAPDWIGSSTKAFLHLMLKHIVPVWMKHEEVRITIEDIREVKSMTREEANRVEYFNAPCLLKDGRMGSFVRSPRDDDDLCGIQVLGEENIRWISFRNLTDMGGGALQEI